MCLDRITKRHNPPVREKLAWKVFRLYGTELHLPYYGAGPVACGEWHTADRSSTGGGYRAGFHAYKTEAGALVLRDVWANAIVVRVRLRKVRVEGVQRGHVCLVADEMYVPRPKVKR